DIDGGSTDNTGISSLTASQTTFDCTHVGTNNVTLTVEDLDGNTSTCTAVVTVEDNTVPTVTTQDITVQLDATGNVSITAADIDNGSGDACGIGSMSLDVTDFDCTDIGPNTVTLTVIDVNSNSATATATVTVEDNLAPVADVDPLPLVTGECSATVTAPTATDNCTGGVTATTTDPTTYTAQGTYTVNWSYADGNGNTSTQTQTVTVEDNIDPLTPTLADVTGECSVTATAPTTTDACAGTITGTTTDALTYNVQGSYEITWIFDDGNGNVITVPQNVIVDDVTDPVAVCQDITVFLDGTGNASITGADVDGGSTDNCTIGSLSVSPNTFTSANLGANTVTLTVTDGGGNTNTCTATVTVEDNTAPTAVCQDITISLDATGNATITAADIDGGSTDNTGISSLTASQTTFDCTHVGTNNVTLTVEDLD
ncbi:MAG: hypothetical protein LC650_03355, partial [Actinobacteria bacterium]|nr:hypothetical protein [Actinomycetota bacterium]